MKRADPERLYDILEAIEKVEKNYRSDQFERDELMQAAMIHFLEIIGEACRSLSRKFRETYQQINWSKPISFRNILVHQYFEIDFYLVQQVIEKELPTFKTQILSILKSIEDKN